MKLLLFDIDGTMLTTQGVGRQAVERALSTLTGEPVSAQGIPFSGKTDPQILREVLLAHGLTDVPAPLLQEAVALYVEAMHELLVPERVRLLDGVRPLLEHLQTRPDVHLALLTGNVEPMAYLKLRAVGLDHHFAFGAFGSDHADRAELPPIAIRRARAHTGHTFHGPDVVIIGDTEHDICCGRGVGAFSVAVCTGHFSRDHLATFGPDVLLDDLRDPALFVRHVMHRAA
ncbi:MAG: HAD family hydrolase [Bacteroidetes bacterium]|nr:hypothetical protein AWN76_000055 [Rhodothermaceae bacterium RA]RMH70112.1 MAG: HAD family hydrolase [Bacteroidota bacterium]